MTGYGPAVIALRSVNPSQIRRVNRRLKMKKTKDKAAPSYYSEKFADDGDAATPSRATRSSSSTTRRPLQGQSHCADAPRASSIAV